MAHGDTLGRYLTDAVDTLLLRIYPSSDHWFSTSWTPGLLQVIQAGRHDAKIAVAAVPLDSRHLCLRDERPPQPKEPSHHGSKTQISGAALLGHGFGGHSTRHRRRRAL